MNNIRLNYIPENNSGLNTRYAGGASLRLSTGLRQDKLLASTAALSTAKCAQRSQYCTFAGYAVRLFTQSFPCSAGRIAPSG